MTVGPGDFDDVQPSRAARLAAERARRLYAGVGILIGSTLAVTALLGIPAALAAASDRAVVPIEQVPARGGNLGADQPLIDDVPHAALDGDPTTQDQAIPGQDDGQDDAFSGAPAPPSPRRAPSGEPNRDGRGSTMQFTFLLSHRPFDEDGDDDEPEVVADPDGPRTGEFTLEPAADLGHRLGGPEPALDDGPTGHTLPPGAVAAVPEEPTGHTIPPNSLIAPSDLRAHGSGTDPGAMPRVRDDSHRL
jgi:hypothetical protein